MAYPDAVIQRLSGVFATLDPSSPNYLKGAALVNFFNSLGFADAYVFTDGKGIVTPDAGESMSRRNYVIVRLIALNRKGKLNQAIQRFIDVSDQPERAETDINNALKETGKVFVSQ